MTNLRPMHKDDLASVNLILCKAFTHAQIKEQNRDKRIPLCRAAFLEMYLGASPGCSFVLEQQHKIVGYCFARLWGQVGWIGPLSVLPSEEGQGYGKQLVFETVESLKAHGALTIGLEMSAQSSRNLGFYAKLGFQPGGMTVDLIRKVPASESQLSPETDVLNYSELTDDEQITFLEHSGRLTASIDGTLDYSKEIHHVSETEFGDACLIAHQGEPVGFFVVHTEPYSQEERREFLKVNVLQLATGRAIATLDPILQAIENLAIVERLQGIYVRVPTRYYEAFSWFLMKDFRIVQNDLRMTLRGFGQKDDPASVNLNKWE